MEEPWKPHKEKLDDLRVASDAECTKIRARCNALATKVDSKEWDMSLSGIKDEVKLIATSQKLPTSHASTTKKMLGEVRSLLSKAASSGSKKRKAGDKASGVAGDIGEATLDYRPALNMVKATVEDAPVGISTSMAELALGVPIVVDVNAAIQQLVGSSGFKVLGKWMKEKIQAWEHDGASPAYGAVVQPTVLATLRQFVKGEPNLPLLFRAPYVPVSPKDQSLHKAVYGVQCFAIPQGHCQAGPSPFGVNEVRVITSGEEVVVAVRSKTEHSLAETVSHLKGMTGAALIAMAKEPGNFAMVIKAGMMAVMPCGYIYIVHRPLLTQGLRWGFTAGWASELSISKMAVASVMEAHSAVRGTVYEQWWDKLCEMADSAA